MDQQIARRSLASAHLAIALIALAGCRNFSDYAFWRPAHSASSDALAAGTDDATNDSRESKAGDGDAKIGSAASDPDAKPPATNAAASPPADAPGVVKADGAAGVVQADDNAGVVKADDATRAILAKDAWTFNLTAPGAKADKSRWRYRNPELEEFLRTPPQERPRLNELVATKLPVISANAAIVQVRWRQGAPVAPLAAAASRSDLRMPLRQAAIEALAAIDRPDARQAIEFLLKRYGDGGGENAAAYVPRLHTELLIAILAWPPSDAMPYWTAALKSPDAQVRLSTLEVLAEIDARLPAGVARLRDDTDSRIRGAALRALAAHHDPQAFEYLRRALDDFDLSVRQAAIAGLGEIKTPASQTALEKMLRQPG